MTTQTQNDRRTSLYNEHLRLKARLVSFAGWEMPVQYTGILEEHQAVRRAAGLFDVSHMGEIHVQGSGALRWLNTLIPNDLLRIGPGRALYTQLCNEAGGTLDDLIVYWTEADHLLLVVNASNIAKDWQWLVDHRPADVTLLDRSSETALLALQGPAARDILGGCTDTVLDTLQPFHLVEGRVLGVQTLIACTGYTGEDGFELFVNTDEAETVWQGLLERGTPRGLKPAGLGARDTLRLEASFPLYGHELDEETSPLEAGLGWSVKLSKEDFIGREALLRQKETGLKKSLVGLRMEARSIARPDYPVLSGDRVVGKVTSGTLAPFLGYPIAMAFLPPSLAVPGETVAVRIRNQAPPASIVKLPFYRRPKPA